MDTSEKYTKMCESEKDIQRFWNFENGGYVFDPYDGEAMIQSGYPPEEYIKVVWFSRPDQYQKICIDFYIQNMGISRDEALFHFLEWYADCLKESHGIGCIIGKNGGYEEINSCEK